MSQPMKPRIKDLGSDTFPSQGLKKTISTMDRELPRSELSINNRNELRNVLHLHSLYKQNKVREYLAQCGGVLACPFPSAALHMAQQRKITLPVFIILGNAI